MSDNKIVNIKDMSDEQIMQAIGQDDGSTLGNNIPRLAINRTPEDDDGNQLPVGHFYTYDSSIGQNVFGKPVTLRPFISAMQYMHYDADKGEYVNRSIIFKSWKEEAIDVLGGTKCGKIAFKDRSSLTPEQLEKQRTIRCYKLVYGLLSFDKGKTANGADHKVENLPVLYRVTGTAFSPVSAALDQLKKRKKLMFNCSFSLDTKRQKKGGNVFYVPEIGVNADANLQLSADDMDTLKVFQESIDTENAEVIDAYKKARSKKGNGSDAIDAKIVEDVSDSSPEEVLAS
ncbi:MAG: hypothetical protein CM15mV146_450 [uncultured marine virus]|jgi:hypothetical protein|nr:MAG: hypothetical protein CM15mV146_450 [uncultured marine virus]|tara:strand:- start:717 stop:1577 length:861 start_codon:yes stop_codon:yes gene_type:complete